MITHSGSVIFVVIRLAQLERQIRAILIMLAICCLSLASCRAMQSNAANPEWVADLARTDSMIVRSGDSTARITDTAQIQRFRELYTNAKWKRYLYTLPGNLNDRTIDVYQGDNELRHFSYVGVLWENERYDSNRTATLSDNDRLWLESLFDAAVPNSQ
ncbi:hypothetical protein N9Z47_04265 [bacterium]|nr:hypothetical protein [bacterium]